ncbi:hypothetical protein BsWGS_23459 [Bradybaena similaris]
MYSVSSELRCLSRRVTYIKCLLEAEIDKRTGTSCMYADGFGKHFLGVQELVYFITQPESLLLRISGVYTILCCNKNETLPNLICHRQVTFIVSNRKQRLDLLLNFRGNSNYLCLCILGNYNK